MTDIIRDPRALFARCEAERRQGAKIGFVPTMGALHDGHMSLVRECNARGATLRVLSIFVNPLQFGPSEDLARYPRTFDADFERCKAHGVDIVYAPTPEAMYPPGFQTQVEVPGVSARFEGSFRPTHFRGVATVVSKLFTAVGPCVAVFGRKDYQQWKVLVRLAEDLNLPVDVVGAPIIRESDGLAMSSRNRYLEGPVRARAAAIAVGLRAAYDAHATGERRPDILAGLVREEVARAFDAIDYIEAADPNSLEPLSEPRERQVILVAARLGATRLIDNLELGHDSRP
jgi:pantoate--beta-alanine ligase